MLLPGRQGTFRQTAGQECPDPTWELPRKTTRSRHQKQTTRKDSLQVIIDTFNCPYLGVKSRSMGLQGHTQLIQHFGFALSCKLINYLPLWMNTAHAPLEASKKLLYSPIHCMYHPYHWLMRFNYTCTPGKMHVIESFVTATRFHAILLNFLKQVLLQQLFNQFASSSIA
jgi:hypothetical protein